MGKKDKQPKLNKKQPVSLPKTSNEKKTVLLPWILLLLGITAFCFYPMLKNGFTNWDDDFYVTINSLLRGPDWKGILTQPVNSNYHPLTILSYAFNYRISALTPYSYLLFNLLLHLANTALVFYFIWNISDQKIWAAVLTAIIFGIHPMHVESVAWISERKDVLYTFFYLSSLLLYWRYIRNEKKRDYWFCFLLFVLSLLSKPAAIVLPVVLFLLDYWKGRTFSKQLIIEKIPFLVASALMAIITLKVQTSAIVALDVFPFWSKPFFACYVIMVYIFQFIYPHSLSAYHPYPAVAELGLPILLSPLFVIGLTVLVWYFRKNKTVVFGVLFFVINLFLVLQVVSIGSAIVSERYTYVPYIGLAFLLGMTLNEHLAQFKDLSGLVVLTGLSVALGAATFQRTKVWKDSGTLWTDVIRQYNDAPLPHSSRADFLYKTAINPAYAAKSDSLFKLAVEDCAIAIKGNPGLYTTYRTRGLIYLQQNRNQEALADADFLISQTAHLPEELSNAYSMRGTANMRLNHPEEAISDFTAGLSLNPADDNAYMNRGATFYSAFKQYDKALADYNKAIEINPRGEYYLNRSSCYYMLGDLEKAQADASAARQKAVQIPEQYKKLLNL